MAPPNDDYSAFAELVRARDEMDEAGGKPAPDDASAALTRLFEAVHEARAAAASGGPLTNSAAVIGSLAMSLARHSGGFSKSLLRRDSFRLLRAGRDAFMDASSRYAVVVGNRCVAMGADLVADFEITDESLAPAMQAVRAAVIELRGRGHVASAVVLSGGTAVARSESGETSSVHRWEAT